MEHSYTPRTNHPKSHQSQNHQEQGISKLLKKPGIWPKRALLYGIACAAFVFLQDAGKAMLAKIDIIARRGRLLVFCEVKFRQKNIYQASPTSHQQKLIARAAALFIASSAHYQDYECRFDGILIERRPYALWRCLIPIINAW